MGSEGLGLWNEIGSPVAGTLQHEGDAGRDGPQLQAPPRGERVQFHGGARGGDEPGEGDVGPAEGAE